DVLFAVTEESGSNPGRAAIAWASAKGVIPVIGPRTRAQLDDNLAATSVKLSAEQIQRLDDVSAVDLGYPHELLAADAQRATMTAGHWSEIDFTGRAVA
ncbi:MAG: aldo/keto reductase, partial [Capsulimonas sp.]|nr:aldo/keto reductase [Capsulimonas sp.]